MDVLKFTVLDDSTHVIGPGEHTVCGLVIPFGNGYSTDQPDDLCEECADKAGLSETTDEDPKPASKPKGKAKGAKA